MKTGRPNRMRFAKNVLALVATGLLLSGCLYSREMNHTRRDIERVTPGADFHRVLTVNVGPFGLRLARWITARADDDDALRASRYLRDVRRVKAGIYRRRDGGDIDLSGVADLRRFQRRGWEVALRVNDEDEQLLLLYRERRETISDIYAVVLDEDDLVIARISGRLNQLLETAIEDHGIFRDLAEYSDFD